MTAQSDPLALSSEQLPPPISEPMPDKADALQVVKEVEDVAIETAKEVATHTAENLTHASDYTLHLLGIPIDTATLLDNATAFAMKLVLAMLIFFVGQWVGKRLVNVAKLAMQKSSLDATAVGFISNLLYGVILTAVILASINQLGVSTTSFVTVLGALAVAIGVSLKDQVSNIAAGVLIVIFHPFRRGDSVEIAGRVGRVEEITLVNTRIRTNNNHEVIVPNGDIMTSTTTNFSSYPNRRIEVVVGIGYDSDIKKAREIMLKLAYAHNDVLRQPETDNPIVRVTALADSSVNLTMYLWTTNDKWFAMQCDLLEEIKYAFDEQGVTIPFPNRTIQIDNLEKALSLLNPKN